MSRRRPRPTDHLPKTTQKMSEVTVSGMRLRVPANLHDDYELIESIASAQRNPAVMVGLFNRVFGDQVPQVKDHIRSRRGYVSASAMVELLKQVIEAAAPSS